METNPVIAQIYRVPEYYRNEKRQKQREVKVTKTDYLSFYNLQKHRDAISDMKRLHKFTNHLLIRLLVYKNKLGFKEPTSEKDPSMPRDGARLLE